MLTPKEQLLLGTLLDIAREDLTDGSAGMPAQKLRAKYGIAMSEKTFTELFTSIKRKLGILVV